jgi:mRNA interferase RelE/StbE
MRKRISQAIDSLETNARPAGSKKLKGAEELYRLRVGDYRIIYTVEDNELLVIVVNTGHRKEVYRRLS